MAGSVKADQLAGHLQRGLSPAYLMHGDDPLLSMEAVDAIRARARSQGFSEREVLTVDRYFDWGALHAAGAGMSLFGDRKIIELRQTSAKLDESVDLLTLAMLFSLNVLNF